MALLWRNELIAEGEGEKLVILVKRKTLMRVEN